MASYNSLGDTYGTYNPGLSPMDMYGMQPTTPGSGAGLPQTQFPTNQSLSYGGNLNYPTYAPGGGKAQGYGQVLDAAGDVGLASGNPYGMVAGGVAKLAGAGVSLYGKYQEAQQARKNYKLALKEYEDQKRQADIDRQREQRRQQRQEGYFGGAYSAGLEDRFASAYGGYRRPGGTT